MKLFVTRLYVYVGVLALFGMDCSVLDAVPPPDRSLDNFQDSINAVEGGHE
jgi:hypothetical protein